MNKRWGSSVGEFRKQICLVFIRVVIIGLVFFPTIGDPASVQFPDKLELLQTLKDGKFEVLESRISAYQKVCEAEPNKEKEDLVVFTLSAFGNSDPALEPKLNQWVEQMPRSYAARLARGHYYQHLGWLSRGANYASQTAREQISRMLDYFDKAVLDFREALSLNPKLAVAYASLIGIATAYGDRASIDEMVKKALNVDPYSFEVRENYLFSLQPKWGGSTDQMKKFLNGMQHYIPKNPGLAALRGYVDYTEADILELSGKGRQAVEFYDRAVQAGEHWMFVYERGENYYALGHDNRALADFNRALELRPQVSTILRLRARIHQKQGKFDEAMEDFNLALQLDPLAPEVLQGRAALLWTLNRFDEALQDIESALKLRPHDAYNLWNKGRLMLRLKDYPNAVSNLKRASELNSEEAGIWYDYGRALHHLGDCAAVSALDVYLSLCNRGQTCGQKSQDWAMDMIKETGRSFTCPKMYFNWRNVWRAFRSGF